VRRKKVCNFVLPLTGAAPRSELHVLGVVLLHTEADEGLAAGAVEGQTDPRLCQQDAGTGVAHEKLQRNVPTPIQRLRARWHHHRLGR